MDNLISSLYPANKGQSKKKGKARPQTARSVYSSSRPFSNTALAQKAAGANLKLSNNASRFFNSSLIGIESQIDREDKSRHQHLSMRECGCASVQRKGQVERLAKSGNKSKAKKPVKSKVPDQSHVQKAELNSEALVLILKLETEKSELGKQLEAAHKNLDVQKQRGADSQKRVKDLEEQLSQTRQRLTQEQKQNQHKRQVFSQQLEALKKQLQSEKTALQQKNLQLQEEKAILKAKLDRIQEELAAEKLDKTKRIEAHLDELAWAEEARSEIKTLTSRLKDLDAQCKSLDAALASQADTISSLGQEKQNLKKEIHQLRDTRKSNEAAFQQLKQKQRCYQARLSKQEESMIRTAQQHKTLVDNLTQAFEKKLKQTIDTFSQSIEIKDKQLLSSRGVYVEQTERLQAELAAKVSHFSEKQAQVEMLERKLTQLQSRFKEQESKAQKLEDELVKVKLDYEAKTRKLAKLTTELKDKEDRIAQLQSQSAKQLRIIGQQEEKASQLEKENREINMQRVSVADRLDSFCSKIQQLETHIQLVTKIKQTLQNKVDELQQQIRRMKKQANQEITSQSKQMRELLTQNQKLKTSLREAEQKADHIERSNKKVVEQLTNRLARSISQKENLENHKLKNQENDIKTLLENLNKKEMFGTRMQEQLCKEQLRCDRMHTELKNLKSLLKTEQTQFQAPLQPLRGVQNIDAYKNKFY